MKPSNEAPMWIVEFAERVSSMWSPLAGHHIDRSCHAYYVREKSHWEISMFPNTDELLQRLSQYRQPNHSINLGGICMLFDTITRCRWQTDRVTTEDEFGCHLSIEGDYSGHSVCLRLLKSCPTQLTPSQESLNSVSSMADRCLFE